MAEKILQCQLEEFLGHYAPWQVPEAIINDAYELYVDECNLRNPPLVQQMEQDNEATASDDLALTEIDPTDATSSGSAAFKALKDIAESLRGEKIERKLAEIKRAPLLCYHDCHLYKSATSKIDGTNFCGDAYLTERLDVQSENADCRDPCPREINLTEVAVAVVFKEHLKDKIQNRRQLLADASQILHIDPRRTWIYGLTIENTMMSIWYFSCSHIVVSTPFDFTKDIKFFVHAFLSLMYATREEIGYDPTVHRVMDVGGPRHVYEVKSDSGTRYFKTLETLFASRVLCITGKKTRVWKAVEVDGYEDGEFQNEKNGGRVVALKDYWLDDNSRSEKAILDDIFKRLEQAKDQPTTLQWAKDKFNKEFMKDQLEDENYKKYFMNIECDMMLTATKRRLPSAKPVPNFLVSKDNTESASANRMSESIQTTDSSMEIGGAVHQAKWDGPKSSLQCEDRMKRHHRLIYEQVGYPLHAVKHLSTSLEALIDTLIALILLYIAGYTHRDISTGNIIVVEGPDGVITGKLSDMEYAKVFENCESSPDPRTGTLFFMAIEIHSGKSLYTAPPTSGSTRTNPAPAGIRPIPRKPARHEGYLEPAPRRSLKATRPKFRFSHDMESFLWVNIYILGKLLPQLGVAHPDDDAHEFFNNVFLNSDTPSYNREELMKMGPKDFQLHLEQYFTGEITGFAEHLADFREELRISYMDKMTLENKFNHDSYGRIYDAALLAFREIMNIETDELYLETPMAARPTSSLSASQPKRQRTPEEQGDEDYAVGKDEDVSVEGLPLRKQPKRRKTDSGQAHLIFS